MKKSVLETLQNNLIQRSFNFYQEMSEDLEPEEVISHFQYLGVIIKKIKEIKSLRELIEEWKLLKSMVPFLPDTFEEYLGDFIRI